MSSLMPVGQGAAAGPTMGLTPQIQAGSQGGAYNTIGGLNAFNTTNIPAAAQLTNNIQNNPFATSYQTGANQAGGMMQNAGQSAFNTGGVLQGAAGNVLNTAFDPQSALYQKYLQNTQQQSQAMNAQSGIASSPYAAGLNAQTLQNFNIGWQAQQLQNQIAGLNAASSAYGQGATLQQGGASEYAAGAQLPYSTYNQIQQAPFAALSQLQQYGAAGSQLPQQQVTDYMSLLGLQPSLAGAQNQTALTQSQLQQTAVNQLGGGIGAILGGIGGLGGLGGFGGMLGGMGPQGTPATDYAGMGGWTTMAPGY
jgi:hypothetical protein